MKSYFITWIKIIKVKRNSKVKWWRRRSIEICCRFFYLTSTFHWQGKCCGIFYFLIFSMVFITQSSDQPSSIIKKFLRNLWIYLQFKLYFPLSMAMASKCTTAAIFLQLMSLIPAANLQHWRSHFSPDLLYMDRGDDVSSKSATGNNNNWGGNFAAGVIDTDSQQWRQYQTASYTFHWTVK